MKKFSLKKLLLTELITVIISLAIGFTILFIEGMQTFIGTEILRTVEYKNDLSQQVTEEYSEIFNSIKENTNIKKEKYGVSYPAEEIEFIEYTGIIQSESIVSMFSTAFLIGIILGVLVYIIAIQEVKGIKLIKELFIALAIVAIIVMLLNIIYSGIMSTIVKSLGGDYSNFRNIKVYNLKSTLIPYFGILILVYIINYIRVRIITNKMNTELAKK